MRRAVFLDRDGTINEERGYLDRLDRLDAAGITQANREKPSVGGAARACLPVSATI